MNVNVYELVEPKIAPYLKSGLFACHGADSIAVFSKPPQNGNCFIFQLWRGIDNNWYLQTIYTEKKKYSNFFEVLPVMRKILIELLFSIIPQPLNPLQSQPIHPARHPFEPAIMVRRHSLVYPVATRT